MEGQQPGPPEYRARFGSRRAALAVDLAGVTVLVLPMLHLVRRYEEGGATARMLLDPWLWLVVLFISGLGAVGGLGLYSLERRRLCRLRPGIGLACQPR